MKTKNILKAIMILGLSLMLVLTFTNSVFADDSDIDWDSAAGANSTANNTMDGNNSSTGSNTVDGNNIVGGNSVSNTYDNPSTSNSLSNNTSNSSSNNTTSNNVSSDPLAYTGSGSTSGIIAIALVIGAFVAIYSYKRISEYKNI